jgi:hypothetical protein
MTKPMTPANIHRQPKNDRSISVAAACAQGTSVARRDVPLTLTKTPPPWEKEKD